MLQLPIKPYNASPMLFVCTLLLINVVRIKGTIGQTANGGHTISHPNELVPTKYTLDIDRNTSAQLQLISVSRNDANYTFVHLELWKNNSLTTTCILKGDLGADSNYSNMEPQVRNNSSEIVINWGTERRLKVYRTLVNTPGADTNELLRVEWTGPADDVHHDTFDLLDLNWYGGGEDFYQPWPLQTRSKELTPAISGAERGALGSVMERYWLNSAGAAIKVDDNVPLFFSLNETGSNKIVLHSQTKLPFKGDVTGVLSLSYYIQNGLDIQSTHSRATSNFFPGPKEIPFQAVYPIWSTWAKYKTNITQTKVLEFAQALSDNAFPAFLLEIDDNWETCYGSEEFDPVKFHDPRKMVSTIMSEGVLWTGVSMWVHPFVNVECELFKEGHANGYFVKDSLGLNTSLTKWWQGREAGLIDATNPEALDWWSRRLRKLKDYGIYYFKFDAGEANWLPNNYSLHGDVRLHPNLYSTKYAEFADQITANNEVRTGVRAQRHEPLYMRMFDKDSTWGYNNGLATLIPTALHFSLLGYHLTLPDMVGGNAYGTDYPDRTMYIRWMQANTFLPAIQFSIAPWDYDQEVVKIAQRLLWLRVYVFSSLRNSQNNVVVRPLWSIAPDDVLAQRTDSQFMLGGSLLVAPILDDKMEREVYLPKGNWFLLMGNFTSYEGPQFVTVKANFKQIPLFYYTKRSHIKLDYTLMRSLKQIATFN